jgi:hypothetical protein
MVRGSALRRWAASQRALRMELRMLMARFTRLANACSFADVESLVEERHKDV